MDSQPPRDPFSPPDRPVHPLERRVAPTLPPTGSAPAQVYPERRIAIPQSQPTFTYILLGVNIIVFLIDMAMGGTLTALGAKSNPEIINGEYWRLITPVFLHLGFAHIIMNSYSLYVVGPQVERTFGQFRFLAIYFLSGLAASLLSFVLGPAYQSVGASGALFGLIGALLPLLYRNQKVLANTRQGIMSLIRVIALNLLFGFSIAAAGQVTHSSAPGIDNWAHIGGLLGGLVLGWFTTPRYAIRYDVTGKPERIEDQTSLQMTWVWLSLIGVALVGAAYFLIVINP